MLSAGRPSEKFSLISTVIFFKSSFIFRSFVSLCDRPDYNHYQSQKDWVDSCGIIVPLVQSLKSISERQITPGFSTS
jgi:hypothetical protein